MGPRNLLIIHHGALGDLVVTFPIIIRLKKKYDQIDILCQIKLGELAQSLHVVDTHFPLESALFASLFTDAVDPMVKHILCSYQEVLLFSNSVQLKSVIGDTTGKPVYRVQPRPEATSNTHITDHILAQLALYRRFVCIDTTSHSILSSGAHLDRRSVQYDPLKIVLHPGSGSLKKCWPVANFIRLASFLRSKGKEAVFVLGPAEHALIAVLKQHGEQESNIYKTDNLIELANILKTSGGFVGNDSGVSHLSAFLGLPTVVVFGPSNPLIWRPTGRSVRTVQSHIDCHPCFDANNNRCEALACFDRITPEIVLDTLMRMI